MLTDGVMSFTKTDSGTVEFVTTDLLSQKTHKRSSIGTSNILNFYCKLSIISVAILRAMKSDPNLEVSMVF